MICLDSDFIIDFLKGKPSAVKFAQEHSDSFVTTEINVFEIFLGVFNKQFIGERERKFAEEFFDSIPKLPFGKNCGKLSAKLISNLIKSGKTISQNDVLIASILLENNVDSIVTGNSKHFSEIKGIKVISY